MATRTLREARGAMSVVSRAPGMAIMRNPPWFRLYGGRERRRIAPRHPRAEIGKLLRHERRARVMRLHAAMLRRKTKRQRHLEFRQRGHLAVEPRLRVRP